MSRDVECLCFIAEWYDATADIIRPYYLNYYFDGTLELIDKRTSKMFLKRIEYDGIAEKDLFLRTVVTIYSRQMNLIEYANDSTRRIVEARGRDAVLLIKPSGYHQLGKILSTIEESDMSIVRMKMIRIESRDLKQLAEQIDDDSFQQNNFGDIAKDFIKDVSVAMEIVNMTTKSYEAWRSAIESAGLSDHVHRFCNPDYFFYPGNFQPTAEIDHCTTCIVRPRMMKEKQAGTIIQEILNAGFELSALELFRLDTESAEEFFSVYKGIAKNYNEMLKYMSSGPCIVLEVRGEDVVTKFREFCGPFDINIAKVLRPQTLRARFGKSNMMNAVHCTDCPEDGPIETQYFFRTLQLA